MHRLLAFFLPLIAAAEAHAQPPVRNPSSSEVRLYARLMSMTDTRTFDRLLVDSALAASWHPLRASAALAVGQTGSPAGNAGARRLRSLLADPDETVASNAAYSLGLLVDSVSVPALAAAVEGRARVAREAAWALGEIGAPARRAIVAALRSPGEDDARTIQLLFAAAKLRPIPMVEIRPYLRMSDKPSVQWAATYVIARNRAPAGVRDLIALATNPDFVRVSASESNLGAGPPRALRAGSHGTAEAYVLNSAGRQRVRAEIARALSKPAAGDSLGDAAVPVLLRLAGDRHPHVRINAVRSLATYGVKGRDAVVAATSDADANTRIAAAQGLGTALDSISDRWVHLWDRDTTFVYRSSLLASAAQAGVVLPAAHAWIGHRDWRFRAAALAAAGSSSDTAVVRRAARAMIRDPDGRVRASAYGFLAGNDTLPHAPEVRKALLAGLGDPDFYARATVLGNLTRHASAAELPLVLDAYSLSLADSGNDARIAAMQYLARAWHRDSASFSPELRARVASMRPSADPLVRAPVDSTSILLSWKGTGGNPRPLSWYQSIVRDYVVPSLRGRNRRATLRTRHGDIVIELLGADAPLTVRNLVELSRSGYYRGTAFHRVVPNFVAQDGDPRGDGNGGPGYAIRDEMNPRRYERGALGMALAGADTGGSQYFITHSPQPHLDGHYTVFGRVLTGYDALDAIVQGDRILSIVVR